MTVKERILAIRIAENVRRQQEYAKEIGVTATLAVKNNKNTENA